MGETELLNIVDGGEYIYDSVNSIYFGNKD